MRRQRPGQRAQERHDVGHVFGGQAAPELHPRDQEGNWRVLAGGAQLVSEDARGCLAYAEGDEVIALVGVKDLVVVRAGNATLVCPRERAQEVKRIVERLADDGERFL